MTFSTAIRKDRISLLLLVCSWLLLAFSSPALAICDERYGDATPDHHYVRAYCPTMAEAWEACKSFSTARGWGAEACGTYPGRGFYEVGWMREAGAGTGAPFYFGSFSAPSNPPLDLAKNAGAPECPDQCFGDPINAGTGNKFESKVEYRGEGVFPLWIEWTYNYRMSEEVPKSSYVLGLRRTFNYGTTVTMTPWAVLYPDITRPAMIVTRPDGKRVAFRKYDSRGVWVGPIGSASRLIELAGDVRWRFEDEGGQVELYREDGKLVEIQDSQGNWQRLSYDASARLSQVVDMQGRALTFEHNAAGRISRIVLPDGGALTLSYKADTYLSKIEYPGGAAVQYLYDEVGYLANSSVFGALTGVIDEEQARHSSTYYDQDHATGTSFLGNLDSYRATYSKTDGRVTYVSINLPSGATRSLNTTTVNNRIVPSKVVTTCVGCAARTTQFTYDTNGRNDLITRDGVVSDYDYDDRGLLSKLVEAKTDLTGNRRTTQTDWHPTFRAPVARRLYDAADTLVSSESWTYNTRGQALTYSRQDVSGASPARTTTTSYCEQSDVDAGRCPVVGLPTQIDGPRTDVSDVIRYNYYAADDSGCASGPSTCGHRKGDLWKVSNALGQVVLEALRYDGAGRLLSSKDVNGVVTDYDYHARGWPTAVKVRGNDNSSEADDQITRIDYRLTGLVDRVTLPDGSYLRYAYDGAYRLTDVFDQAGNTLHYTLDGAGNRKQEDIKTASGTLKHTMSRVYNFYNELSAVKDAAQNATSFSYDAWGNPDRTIDALGRVTDQDYDPLGRLVRSLEDVGGLEAQTDIRYNARNQAVQVTDPNRLATHYRYNGFGDQVQLESPDTGITDYTYNAAGQLATKKGANDAEAHRYVYDALGRPKAIFYTAAGAADVEYDYDTVNTECTAGQIFAVGRLTASRTEGNELKYCYDRFGQIVRKVQIVAGKSFTLQYAYTPGGKLSAVTYPDGAVVDYVRDAQARIQEIGVRTSGGVRTVLLNNATYEPFGPVTGWTYGNGRTLNRTYDQDYRPKTILDSASGGLSLGYGYNAVGELTELKDGLQSAVQAKYDYDTLGRLKVTRDGASNALDTYGYDKTGNRTSLTHGGITDAYAYPLTSHRLSSVAGVARDYDAAGNTTSVGDTAKEFIYNANDRLSQFKQAGVTKASYRYNTIGQRVAIMGGTTGTPDTYTLYDEAGHWIGDYDSTGAAKQQTVWFGNAPVGLMVGSANTQKLHYVQPDPLGTPRAVIDPSRNVAIWTWDAKSEAFGNSPPNQDADQDGTAFVFNMRFPGQRYDATSGLVYNYFRDYDPSVGRYLQSDPIGLQGGVNTYLYAGASPTLWKDPFGLDIMGVHSNADSINPGSGHAWIAIYSDSGALKETWSAWHPKHEFVSHLDSPNNDLYKNVEKIHPERYNPEEATSFYFKLSEQQLARFREFTRNRWKFDVEKGNCSTWTSRAVNYTFPGAKLDPDEWFYDADTPRQVKFGIEDWKKQNQFRNNSLSNPTIIIDRNY